MENLSNETSHIFKKAGVVDPLPILDQARRDSIRPIEVANKKIPYTDYWRQVPPAMIDKIRFFYRYELLLFGYPETPFTL